MPHPESLDLILAAWNESEPDEIRGLLEKSLSPEIEFIDPSVVARGLDEFEANVHEVHARLPGAEYLRASGVDSHHNLYRYAWEIRRDGELVLSGFDVTEVDDEGRVVRVLGFFGPLPEDG
jgi:hypothetical protein